MAMTILRFILISLLMPLSIVMAAPIVVLLKTEEQPAPLYFVIDNDGSYTKSYVDEMRKIARFDFDHNSKTSVAPTTQELDQLALKEAFKEQKHLKTWQDKGIELVVVFLIKEGKLEVEVIEPSTKKIKAVHAISLTGKVDEDRKKFHTLADTILENFFQIQGIAGSRIAFTDKRRINANKEVAEVWESDYDGANLTQLTKENALCVTPIYLPSDKDKKSHLLCYVSYKTGQPKLKMVNLQNGISQPLIRLRGQQMMPSFSPQRDSIAFISDLTGNPDLFLVDLDENLKPESKPRQIYGTRYSTQGSPTFSPDGKQIAFVSNKDGKPRIYTMAVPAPTAKIEQITPTLISKRPVEASAPAWSPDGTKIAYCAKTGDYRQIYVYELSTGKEIQITTGSSHKENPCWAKNSVHLLYNAGNEASTNIFLVDIIQKKPVQITQGKNQKRFPAWRN